MNARNLALGGALTAVVCVALLVRWSHSTQQHLRMDYCLRTEASCLGSSLAQEQALIDLLAKPRRSKADKAAALGLMRGLRDCWRYAGDLHANAPDDGYFLPLHQAEIWVAQTVEVGDDAIHLDPRRDAGILRSALAGLRGNLAEQRRNLLAFAAASRDLPWTPAQALALEQWAQSLQPGR
jgi:hypothetical protein